jgi:hypothetical protein
MNIIIFHCLSILLHTCIYNLSIKKIKKIDLLRIAKARPITAQINTCSNNNRDRTNVHLLQPVGSGHLPNGLLYIISYISSRFLIILNKYQPRATLFTPILSRFHMCRVRIIAPLGNIITVCVRFLIISSVHSVGVAHTKQPLLILT